MVKWDLSGLYKKFDDNVFEKEISKINNKVKVFEKYKSKLNKNISSKKVIEIFEKLEDITYKGYILDLYIEMKIFENTASQKWTALYSQFKQFYTELSNKIMFFGLWWKDLDEKNAKRIINNGEKYKHVLYDMRRFRKHILNENEEKIINVKDVTGRGSFFDLYNILTNSFSFDFDGKKGLTMSEMGKYAFHKDGKKREAASKLTLGQYEKKESLIGEIYRNIVLSWMNDGVKLRGYKSPISVRNMNNDISDKAVDVLLKVCEKNAHIFHEFFKLKAKILGEKKLMRHDLLAPINKIDMKFKYDEAVKTVLDVYYNFDKEFGDLANKLFKSKHVHSDIQKGKRSGACAIPVAPKKTPYILMNFLGKFEDLETLTHEMGHCIHFMMAKDKTNFDFGAGLPMSETASIFGEMLMYEYFIENDKLSKSEKTYILFNELIGLFSAIPRQAFFVMFEKQAYEMIKKGATIKDLDKLQYGLSKKQFGNGVIIPERYKNEWKVIPHIFDTPFYCYAYSFGNLLVLALYNMYKKEGKKFIPKYKKILSYGGSERPAKILKEIGIDIEDEKFWQSGFDEIKEKIKELKKLMH
jgi:oligoendopeptidase F